MAFIYRLENRYGPTARNILGQSRTNSLRHHHRAPPPPNSNPYPNPNSGVPVMCIIVRGDTY